MNFNEQELEKLLRNAPQPQPTRGLKKELLAQVRLPQAAKNSPSVTASLGLGGWLRRWWPALVPAACSLACGVVMAVQQAEMRDLKSSIGNLASTAASSTGNPASSIKRGNAAATETASPEATEIAQLTERSTQLAAEIAALEQKRGENDALRKELSKLTATASAEMSDEAQKAKERAMRVACINNLKQLGLAMRVYANENRDTFPTDLLQAANEMNTPKILHCPADTSRSIATSWNTYTPANSSYDYLAAGGTDVEPTRVMFRCNIHGTFGLCDGSVQVISPEKQPALLIEKDGKLFMGQVSGPSANSK